MLSKIKNIIEKFDKKLKALVIFGSYAINPLKAKDIDILIIIDKILNIEEKINLEIEISKELRKILKKPVDIIVMDEEIFHENIEPGTVLSGFVIGYKKIYDNIGFDYFINNLIEKLAEIDYEFFKNFKEVNLSSISRVKLRRRNISL